MRLLSWLLPAKKKQAIGSSHELLEFLLAGGAESAAGVSVTPTRALQQATVYACVRVLSEVVAQLPLHVYRRNGRSKEKDPGHPLFPILHSRPNSWQTSFQWREQAMAHVLLRGNAYSLINRDADGIVRELIPLSPDSVGVTQREDLSLLYTVRMAHGERRDYPAARILHITGLSLDGVHGCSVIKFAKESIGSALAADDFGARLFKNKAVPGGVLTHPAALGAEKITQLRQEWDSGLSGENAHRTAILHSGLEWKAIAMTAEDAQFVDSMKLKRRDIAAVFRVPPYKLGDVEQQPRANVEQQALEFVTDSVLPWLVRFEQALWRDLIADDQHFAGFQVAGLLRGDIKTRYESYKTAIMFGIMSPNEVRELENLNPREGGDEYFMPLNLSVGGDDVGGIASDSNNETRARAPQVIEVIARDAAGFATKILKREAHEIDVIGPTNGRAAPVAPTGGLKRSAASLHQRQNPAA